jgi:hypothetical protein
MLTGKTSQKGIKITMNETDKKNKAYGSVGRDWEQHAFILFHLHEKRMTVRGLAESIHERFSHVSECLWGMPGRRNPRIEAKVAEFLGVGRDELFGSVATLEGHKV